MMVDLSQETEALARRVAEAQHTTIDHAIKQALEVSAHATGIQLDPTRPPRDTSAQAIARRRENAEQIIRELAAMPILDPRSPQEIIDDLNAI